MRRVLALCRSLAAAVAATALLAAPAAAADGCSRHAPSSYERSPRIESRTVDGIAVNVLLPASYGDQPARRYPVLLLLHPAVSHESTWLAETDLAQFTAGLPARQEAIVVMPDGGSFGFYMDWADGSHHWETFHLRRLLPWIEHEYRALAGARHRAVAGFSMGGFGALHYAGRHPELFSAVGSFSGVADIRLYGSGPLAAVGLGAGQAGCDGRAADPSSPTPFGPPPGEAEFQEHNPLDLVDRYRDRVLYVAAGNGVPCPADPRSTYSAFHLAEPAIRDVNRRFTQRLAEAGVPHTARFFDCGMHVMPTAQRALHEFWPQMAAAVGAPDTVPSRPAGRLRILRTRLRARRGHVLVPVRCTAGPCRGTLRLRGGRARTYALAEGVRATVRLRLDRPSRATLRRRRAVRARLLDSARRRSVRIVIR